MGRQTEVEGEHPVGAGQVVPHVAGGDDVQHAEVADGIGVIECRAERDQRAPIVANHGGAVLAEGPDELDPWPATHAATSEPPTVRVMCSSSVMSVVIRPSVPSDAVGSGPRSF